MFASIVASYFALPHLSLQGQLRLSGPGQNCLSVKGLAAGSNVALKSAVSASSTADTGAHGASMAVDGSSNTFWVQDDTQISVSNS